MPFLDFDGDYENMVESFRRSGNDHDHFFYKWLAQNRTRLTLQTHSQNNVVVSSAGAVRRLSKNKRDFFKKSQAFNEGKLLRFVLSEKSREELVVIRELFRAAGQADAMGEPLPPEYCSDALLRRRAEDLMTLHKQKLLRQQQADAAGDVDLFAALPGGYKIVIIKTEREAIREGDAMLNCLRDLRYPPTMHSHPMGSYITALMEGRLMSMRDAEDRSVATLRFSGEMVGEVRGFKNGGLLHAHAMILRDHFTRHQTPLDITSAERVGLVYSSGAGLVPYEQELPHILNHHTVQVDGWPVTNEDMQQLRGARDMHRISVINCASLSALPDDIVFRDDRRSGVIVRYAQNEPWPLQEANDYLAYLHESRPKFERSSVNGLNLARD